MIGDARECLKLKVAKDKVYKDSKKTLVTAPREYLSTFSYGSEQVYVSVLPQAYDTEKEGLHENGVPEVQRHTQEVNILKVPSRELIFEQISIP